MIAYIPVRGPEIEDIYSDYERFLKDFSRFTKTDSLKSLIDNEERIQSIDAIVFDIIYDLEYSGTENEVIKSINIEHPFFHESITEHLLKIEISFKRSLIEIDEHAEIRLNTIISKLALLLNLTYATKIDFLSGVIFSNEKQYLGKTDIVLNSLAFAYEHAINIGWPKLDGLNLQDTIAWYNLNSLHTDNNSRNKLQRAINSFSYQFSNILESESSILFWTMLGIEALLAEGNSSIINQIKVKSSLILGEPSEYKKKLDKLYNYRSRFVHGDIDFPAKFSSDYDNFEEEYYDYLHFASSILIALIRSLIADNKSEFNFHYSLK